MHDKFLAGEDYQHINYEEIDNNEFIKFLRTNFSFIYFLFIRLYDDIKQMTADKEDLYFDDENEGSNLQMNKFSEYNGIQDF